MDLALTLGTLPLWLPACLAVALAVRWRLGSPALFRQVRPGLLGRPFTLWKFRTMHDVRDAAGRPLPDADRMDPVCARLRAAGLDELPELVLVLAGTMSLVGPRPLLMEYLPRYTPEQRRRHLAKPGITGLAQVEGRNACDWEEQFRLDAAYVDALSPWLDLRILWRTAGLLLSRRGATQPGQATREPFRGSSSDCPPP